MKKLCQITDIGYEFGYIPLSSSKRDGEDNTSDTDKYEMGMIKQNEGIYLQSRVNDRETISRIDSLFGPFNEEEVAFQRNNLRNSVGNYQNSFQRELVLSLFYKYFGDPDSTNCIDPATDYIKLMLTARNMLLKQNFTIMPYVLCAKVEKLVPRKTINKREETEMMSSKYYPMVVDKFRDPKVLQQILSSYATVISSTFRIIDMNNPNINGRVIDTVPAKVLEELMVMSLMT